jgi:hypothetical protein
MFCNNNLKRGNDTPAAKALSKKNEPLITLTDINILYITFLWVKEGIRSRKDFMGNYISGSTEPKECQALFQLLVENPVRDQEI